MAATPTLILNSNNATNGNLSVDLSRFLDLTQGSGLDPQDPNFREALISHSLLKEGGVLALEDLKAKELIFPVRLNSTTAPGLATLIQQINMVVGSPGATYQWQDANLSQPTLFDSISGQLDLEYDYRQSEKFWMKAKLRLFAQPLGRTAAPRAYAAASGVGPLLMISPYASSGALTIGQSTQAGVAGWGGAPAGASTGIFYSGSPSLAGDGPALLQISYVGPLPSSATATGVTPTVAVSLLPDPLYRPLITAPQITIPVGVGTPTQINATTAVASSYLSLNGNAIALGAGAGLTTLYTFPPLPAASTPGPLWAGDQRLFAIARASTSSPSLPGVVATLNTVPNALVKNAASAAIPMNVDWAIYDMGTFSVRPSQLPYSSVTIAGQIGGSGAGALDVTALMMLPDSTTWFVNSAAISASQYGYPPFRALIPTSPWTNTLLIDDVMADQFMYSGQSQTFAPSPIGSIPSSARITPYARGLVPRPESKNGLPIIAILGMGNAVDPPFSYPAPTGVAQFAYNFLGGSQANPQNLRAMAQVNILERTRYVLP